jgi:YfiH family protein
MTAVAAPAELPAPFAWAGDHVAIDLGHGAHAVFTGRRGGVSRGLYASLNLGPFTDDDPAAVAENRARVAAAAGVEEVLSARQVHGTRVARDGEDAPEADAHVTARTGVGCLVLTADCLPVALAAEGAVAMVHAGWKGVSAQILREAVAELRSLVADGAEISGAIGPCARGCCYEVRDDVREALGVEPFGRPAPIDLPAIAREQLHAAGVATVHDCGLCTMCTDRSLFFSHRRDGPVTGRQGGIAWRRPR